MKKLTKKDLECSYSGQLSEIPNIIVERMLECQVEQGNKRDVTVFEKNIISCWIGFNWEDTKERSRIWYYALNDKYFQPFYDFHGYVMPDEEKLPVSGELPDYAKKFIVWLFQRDEWHYDGTEELWKQDGYRSRTTDELYLYYKTKGQYFRQPPHPPKK